MKDYLFPIITGALLCLFFMGLPELDKAEIIPLSPSRGCITKKDFLIMALITLVFGAVDFWGLGSKTAPQSFVMLNESCAVIEFQEGDEPASLMLYSGPTPGTVKLELSRDGENFFTVLEFDQNYAEVLKWHRLYCEGISGAKFARVSTGGEARIGELVFFDSEGNPLSCSSSCAALFDEQDCCPEEYSFYNSTYFDEIYHARTAWEHLNGVWPYEISHPPLGKLIIALGISLFGMTPFGWRFSGTLAGVVMLPVMYVLLKKMFKDSRVAACGTLVFAFDFMRFVQTRIATIDSFAVLFILLMYLFMYLYISGEGLKNLGLSGLFFGIGAACKWTCLYAGAGLALIWGIHRIKLRKEGFFSFLKNCLFCLLCFVFVPALIYYLAYIPYGLAEGITPVFSKEYLRLVLENQEFMFSYHSKLVAEHPYSSKWYQWVLNIRPILYYLQYYSDGSRSSFGAWLNPMLCWGGLVAMFIVAYMAAFKKCRTALFIFIGYLAQLLPWVFITRLTFEYHYFASSVFLVAAVAYVFALMKKAPKAFVYGFTALSGVLFILFYPALSGLAVSTEFAAKFLHWLPTWPF